MKKIIPFALSLIIVLSGSAVEAETTIERLVKKIVTGRESNDDKVYIIERWVSKNIRYRGDKEQFNMDDRLTLPMETLQRRKGDCEDGAILLMDLAVTAGVPRERLRLYAPIVLKEGYHASVAYQREADDVWVWVEWTVKLAYKIGNIKGRPSMNRISSFIPLGDYFEVTSHNPFKMMKYFDLELAVRAKKILEQKNWPHKQ